MTALDRRLADLANKVESRFVTLRAQLAALGGGVASVFGRTGAIVMLAADVTTALGFVPYNASNPTGFISAINGGMVTAALGYTPTSVTGLTGVQSVAAFKIGLAFTKADVGLGSVDNTADAAKNVLTATKLFTARTINGVAFDGTGNITINAVDATARAPAARLINTTAPLTGGGDLSADRTIAIPAATGAVDGYMTAVFATKLNGIAAGATANSTDATLLARANHTGTQAIATILAAATARIFGRNSAGGGAGEELTGAQVTALLSAAVSGGAQGVMSGQDKARLDAAFTRYHSLLDCCGWLTAADAASTYGMGQGDKCAVTGVGTQYPLNSIFIAAADYPAAGTLAAKLRIRVAVHCNDVAPGVTFTIGLHPITRPATSGGAGVAIYTIGAAVASSTVAIATPAADSSNVAVTAADFALPADGHYVIGVVTSGGALAASSHVHISAILQMRYA